MTRYVLNSAVLTTPGDYSYRHVSEAQARDWLDRGPFESAVAFEQTAAALSEIVGFVVPACRKAVFMLPDDEALIARIKMPMGEARGLSVEELSRRLEIGLLRRVA